MFSYHRWISIIPNLRARGNPRCTRLISRSPKRTGVRRRKWYLCAIVTICSQFFLFALFDALIATNVVLFRARATIEMVLDDFRDVIRLTLLTRNWLTTYFFQPHYYDKIKLLTFYFTSVFPTFQILQHSWPGDVRTIIWITMSSTRVIEEIVNDIFILLKNRLLSL